MRKYLLISVVIILLDQISKTIVEYYMALGESIQMTPFFNITLIYNHGAAFGFLSEHGGWQRWFFLTLSIVITIFLLRWIMKLKSSEKLIAISLGLILGGAIGNIIDRIYYGYVIDFLDFYIGTYHWYIFNLADSAVVTGAFIILWDLWVNQQKNT